MKKIFWLFLGLIALLPLISATDNPAGLDLYYLFVENVFGGFLWATLGMTALFIVFGMLSRMSATLLIMLCGLFITVSLVGWGGIVFEVILFLLGLFYFGSGLVKFVSSLSGQ